MRDLRKVGAAIDTMLAHGVMDVSGVRFQASDISVAQEAALREATERARRQAEAIAEASGGRLGRTLSLSTQQESRYDPCIGLLSASGMSDSSAGERGPGTEVIQPAVPVRVTVHGRWELLGHP